MKKSFKICLNAVLASGVLLLSGCSQGAASYREVEEKYFQASGTTFDGIAPQKEDISAIRQRVDIDLSIPALSETSESELGGIDLSALSFYIDGIMKDDTLYGIFGARINGKEAKAEYWADKAAGEIYALLPGISDIYAYCSLSEYLTEYFSTDEIDFNQFFSDTQQMLCEIQSVAEETAKVYFELAGEPEIVKNQEFTVNAKTYQADMTAVKLDKVSLAKLLKAFIDKLLENEIITTRLCEIANVESKDELISNEELVNLRKRLEDTVNSAADKNTVFDMTVYIKDDEIIGREMNFFTDTDSPEQVTFSLNMYSIPDEKGRFTYIECKQGEESLIFKDEESDGVHKGEGKYVLANGYEHKLSYDNFAISNDLFQGNISFQTLGLNEFIEFSATVGLKKEEKGERITVNIPNICTASIFLTPSKLELKEAPTLNKSEYADFGSTDYDEANEELKEKFLSDVSEFFFGSLSSKHSYDNIPD